MYSLATLESIFSSEAKVEILRTLSIDKRAYSAQNLEKVTTKSIATIYDALEELRNEDVLNTVQTDGKTKYYRINDENQFLDRIQTLTFGDEQKTNLGTAELPPHPINTLFNFRKRLIQKLDGLKKIILFGSAAQGSYSLGSDLDLYIVVEEKRTDIENQIYDISNQYDHEFSLVIKGREQYESDFSKPLVKLADSIIKEGYAILYGDAEQLRQYTEPNKPDYNKGGFIAETRDDVE